MNLVLELFLTFFKIGLFTFGGGYAMISIIENNCIEKKNWITHDEMMDVTVIASQAESVFRHQSENHVKDVLLENVSVEHILKEDPDFIFFAQVGDDMDEINKNIQQFIDDNPIWQELTAVKEGRVYSMDKALYNLKPNERWGEAYEKLEQILSEGQK